MALRLHSRLASLSNQVDEQSVSTLSRMLCLESDMLVATISLQSHL